MPELKWTSPAALEPGRSYVVFASQLPSAGMRAVPAFLRHTMRITRQLRNSPGLVAYSLRADIAGHQFWTLSVWQDGAALQAFVRAEPHATTMRELARTRKTRCSRAGPPSLRCHYRRGTRSRRGCILLSRCALESGRLINGSDRH